MTITTIRRGLAATLLLGVVSTAACTTATAADPAVGATGLFIGCYQSEGMPGAPILHLNLVFNAPNHSVGGQGRVTQATNPPLDMPSKISGGYSVMTVMPNTTHIQVRMTGTPPITWPAGAGPGPVFLPNLDATMVLGKDWKSGEVQFSYATGIAEMSPTLTQKVAQVPCSTTTN